MRIKIISTSLIILLVLSSWIPIISSMKNDTDSTLLNQSNQTADAGGPYTGTVGIPIQFDGSKSNPSNISSPFYEWSCGDGLTETGISTSHIYTTAGTYTLILTITGSNDECLTDSTTVTIVSDNPPEITFQNPKPGSLYYRNTQVLQTNGTTIVIGPSEITVEATDDVEVQRVEIYIDGERKHIAYQAPYTYRWKVDTLLHTVTAIVYDTSGNSQSIEQSVFKWKLHPLIMLKTLKLLQNIELSNGLPTGFNDNEKDSHLFAMLTILRILLNSNEKNDSILSILFDQVLNNDDSSTSLYEYLKDHPLINNRLKNKYPYLHKLIMISHGDFTDTSSNKLFEDKNNRMIKTIATLTIIKTISEQIKTRFTPEPTPLESFYQWIINHPYLVLVSSLLFIQLISRLLNDYSTSDNDDFDEPTKNRIPHPHTGGPYRQEQGKMVTFSAEKSYDEDGTIVTFLWDFGDGTTASGEEVEHRYDDIGTYLVTLTVIDDDGAEANETTTVIISEQISPNINDDSDMSFWIISGALTSIMGIGITALTFRRRLFE